MLDFIIGKIKRRKQLIFDIVFISFRLNLLVFSDL